MLVPLLIMIFGFTLYFAWLVTRRLQGEILERERQARWVQRLAAGEPEMSDFLHMGGYAAYVWTAYGITLVVIVVNGWLAVRGHARSLARVRQMKAPHSQNERRPTVRMNP